MYLKKIRHKPGSMLTIMLHAAYRHAFATRAAMSGMDLVTLAAVLGHSRIQMVLRYAHPTEEHQSHAMKRFEEFNASMAALEYERASTIALQ